MIQKLLSEENDGLMAGDLELLIPEEDNDPTPISSEPRWGRLMDKKLVVHGTNRLNAPSDLAHGHPKHIRHGVSSEEKVMPFILGSDNQKGNLKKTLVKISSFEVNVSSPIELCMITLVELSFWHVHDQ